MPPRFPGRTLRPTVEVTERPGAYRLLLEMPVGAEGEVHLDIRDGVLRLTSRRPPSAGGAGRAAVVGGGWDMSVDFGDLLSGDDLSAVQCGGRLVVTLPKADAGDDDGGAGSRPTDGDAPADDPPAPTD